jgi:hypothetical protein
VYLKLDDEDLRQSVTPVPIIVDQLGVAVTLDTARPLGRLVEAEARRTDATTILWGDSAPDWSHTHPGVVENRFGKGICRYLAFPFRCDNIPNVWIKRLVGVLVRDAVGSPLVSTNAGPGIEITLNRQNSRLVLHLCNHHAGDPNRLSIGDNLLTIGGIEVTIDLARAGQPKASKVSVAPSGAAMEHKLADGRLTISVPPFSISSVIAID